MKYDKGLLHLSLYNAIHKVLFDSQDYILNEINVKLDNLLIYKHISNKYLFNLALCHNILDLSHYDIFQILVISKFSLQFNFVNSSLRMLNNKIIVSNSFKSIIKDFNNEMISLNDSINTFSNFVIEYFSSVMNFFDALLRNVDSKFDKLIFYLSFSSVQPDLFQIIKQILEKLNHSKQILIIIQIILTDLLYLNKKNIDINLRKDLYKCNFTKFRIIYLLNEGKEMIDYKWSIDIYILYVFYAKRFNNSKLNLRNKKTILSLIIKFCRK